MIYFASLHLDKKTVTGVTEAISLATCWIYAVTVRFFGTVTCDSEFYDLIGER